MRSRTIIVALGVIVGFAPAIAIAEPRPTEGGLWGFAPTDVVQTWDAPEDRVRVHFSVAGPSTTALDDEDGDLVPDFPQAVARTVDEALALYTGVLSLRPPVAETEVGDVLGGSEALDVYLVDFDGAADGRFGIDACALRSDRCAGFLVVENDFLGYGYESLDAAIATVASHETFHAVQAAYADLPVWMSEGTATWATRKFDPSLPDFVDACAGYLADPGRPIDSPPPGPVPAFAYGTALFWDFLAARQGEATIDALLTAMDDDDADSSPVEILHAVIERDGDSLEDTWTTFVRHDLAVGSRAGRAPSHPYAAELSAIEPDAEGSVLDLDARLYPLAASYWHLAHEGGPIVLGSDAPLPEVVFSLHAVADGLADGPVGEAIATFTVEAAGGIWVGDGADWAAGGYWIVGTLPVVADGPARARICIGPPAHVDGCDLGGPPSTTTEGGGEPPSSETSGGSSSGGSGSSTAADESSSGELAEPFEQADAGCACAASRTRSQHAPVALVLVVAIAGRPGRRRGR